MSNTKSFAEYVREMSLSTWIELFGSVFSQEHSKRVPFNLWPKQASLCAFYEYWHGKGFLEYIFPKARQNGVSELAGEKALKDSIAYPNNKILCISSSEPKAKEFLKVRFLDKYNYILRNEKKFGIKVPRIVRKTQTEVEFDNGSIFMSLPASDTAGQGFSASGLILDECGAIDRNNNASFNQIYINAIASIEKAGKRGWCFQIGTSEPGTAYNTKVKKIVDGQDLYTKLYFIGWDADPSRDERWLEKTKSTFPDEVSFKTQYPLVIEDFFVVKEGLVIPQFDSSENGRHVKDFTPPEYFIKLIFGYDHGYNHPSVLLTTLYHTRSKTLFVWDEWYRTKMDVYEQSSYIKRIIASAEGRFNVITDKRIADSAIFNKKDSHRSIADEFATNGITFSKARKHGGLTGVNSSLEKLRKMFHQDRIVIHPRCINLINDLTSWKYKKNGSETVEDINDDGIDVLRYIIEDLYFDGTVETDDVYVESGYGESERLREMTNPKQKGLSLDDCYSW